MSKYLLNKFLYTVDRDPELVHAMAIASMDGEFCTALNVCDALSLLDSDDENLVRKQGNE